MSKTIKLEDEVYHELYDALVKGETFSQGVCRLLDILRALRGLEPVLAGQKAYHEWKQRREDEKAAVIR